ncbi:hypothetical protein ACQKEI_06205 [Psychrobacter namhaensis]|jgi:hypothetical protein|uniref:hypothetical protein n=1 Tax=Psychrobacter namhaensis TaxID=292734 RepID=UPI003CFE939B
MSIVNKAFNIFISQRDSKKETNERLIIDEYGNLRVNYKNKSVQEGMAKQIQALKRMEARKALETEGEAG